MLVITLINGKKYFYNTPIKLIDIAKEIFPNFQKICLAGTINGVLCDLDTYIKQNSKVSIITLTDIFNSLKIIRYSCCSILGCAIKQLWPDTKLVEYSITDKGFYYDIDHYHNFTIHDLNVIKDRMNNIITDKCIFIKKVVSYEKAFSIFKSLNENYKLYLLKNLYSTNKDICIYTLDNYIDIVNHVMVPDLRFCKNFILEKVSGAYWMGISTNKMLQRIYGTAYSSSKELNLYLDRLKQINKRDHRKISSKLNLFHIQENAPGVVFWHHNGYLIFKELKKFIREKLSKYKYLEVKSPLILDKDIWNRTGHLENYKESIYITSTDNKDYCIKPMNCPGHVQIFNNKLHTYKDLPVKISEFGICHRYEKSGALHGLMRLREFTQDDAHIFCTLKQIHTEINNCIDLFYEIYSVFGFQNLFFKFSTRPKKRIGNNEIWNKAEQDLIKSLNEKNINFELQEGEGAFYGPKIELILTDSLDRTWQCGTIQLDFLLPSILNSFYIDKYNKRKIPVIIHRAILGSLERFIGILIEEYAGSFPVWLAPVQVVIINIHDNQSNYVIKLTNLLLYHGIRVKSDLRKETVGFKIRDHASFFVPYILICGKKELEDNKVTIRLRSGKNIGMLDIEIFIQKIKKEILERSLYKSEE
ncbi:threonine--tRNA ligase [Buchnera aphidicola (Neophyllaphis podocarpi)]|uniref:threonine--tRNA ligase n=1 Tax=Buchnera aphidicola TaxID=9 RepID=UPI0031B87185